MIYILSWTTKKHQKTLSRPLHLKLKKIQGLFMDLHRNLRTFQGKMECKDFSRTSPKIKGLFKTVRTLLWHKKNSSCLVIQLLPTDGHRDEKFWKVADQEQSRAVTMTPQRRTDRQMVHKLGRWYTWANLPPHLWGNSSQRSCLQF